MERGNWRGILDRGVENLGRKVICGHIATYRYGITAGRLDFVHDSLRLLFVEAAFCVNDVRRASAPQFYV